MSISRSSETTYALGDDAARQETELISRLVQDFPAISLEEMQEVALQNRSDTKFLLRAEDVSGLLRSLRQDYRVLEIEGRRLHHYLTLYFDTREMDLYLRHHAGDRVRDKVRLRRYLDSGLAYLEIKHKNNKGLTTKERFPITNHAENTIDLRRAIADILTDHPQQPGQELGPTISNEFSRVTFVDSARGERVTIDCDLRFSMHGQETALPGIAIVEVKQSGHGHLSPVVSAIRSLGMTPESVSKYCLGVALLDEDVKHNAFKPKLQALQKLMRRSSHG